MASQQQWEDLTTVRLASPVSVVEAVVVVALLAWGAKARAVVLLGALAAFVHAGVTYRPPVPVAQQMDVVVSRPWNVERPFARVKMERPSPGFGNVVVAVKAVTMNPVDVLRAKLALVPFARWYIPPAQQIDFAGDVMQSSCVAKFRVGERVFGLHSWGTLAERIVVPCDKHVARIPEGVTHVQAVVLPTVLFTALEAFDGRISGQSSVMVVGASSAVGQVAIKYLKHAGVARIACVVSKAKEDLAVKLGCDRDSMVDYKLPEKEFAAVLSGKKFAGQFDLVYDAVSSAEVGDYYPSVWGTLKEHVRADPKRKAYFAVNAPIPEALRMVASKMMRVDVQRANYELILGGDLYDGDKVAAAAPYTTPEIAKVYSDGLDPDAVAQAYRAVGSKHPGGKHVLLVRST